MADVLVTGPEAEPLSTQEAMVHLRIDEGDPAQDQYLRALIVTARRFVEKRTWRALVTQTWERTLEAFPAGELELAGGRLQEIVSVKYIDEAGVERPLASDAYQVDKDSEPGRIAPAYGQTWPTTRRQLNAVRVRYIVGYGDADAVPEELKAAMKLLIGHLYEHRESEVIGTITSPLQLAIDALVAPYRLNRVG